MTLDTDGVRVDVVVPTYNNRVELQLCLDSIGLSDAVSRVLVCVDGSTDGTQDFVDSADYPFEVLLLEHADRANHGRAATRNLALPDLRAPHVLLLDSDMQLAPGAIERHLAMLNTQRCVSVGAVRYDNARANLWARYLMTRGANRRRAGMELRPLDFVTANSAMRTGDLIAAGGFDESLSGYGGEDTELALRLHERGIPFVFNADAVATSIEQKSVAEGLDQLRHYGATNLRTTRARHPELPAPYRIDHLESPKLGDRAFRALLNPLTDLLASLFLRIPWFQLQRRLLNYKVLRAVWAGYREGRA